MALDDNFFDDLFDGKIADEEIKAQLIALADAGETAAQIASAAKAMRARMITANAPAGAIDVCGTGGDGQHSLNVSTAVALVVAACDVPMAKHGNRAASSKAGAADTLEALGLDLAKAAQGAERTLNEIGIGFFFAQNHHPALGPIAPIRKDIGRRTIFNLLGPLCNPCGVKAQLIGVASPDLVERYAQAMLELGYESALVVSGEEGLDEISIAGPTKAAWLRDGAVEIVRITPEDAGLPRAPLEDIRGGDAAFNAAALTRLLAGEKSAYRDAVILNAAAALMVAGEADTLQNGAEEAAEVIDKGLAKTLLDCWIANQ